MANTYKKPIAIVLGGTFPHIALIRNLQRRGYFTVLVDYYENPPAKRAADEHIRASTLDQEKVLEIARRVQAQLVISTCIDQANVTACYVAEKLGLPAPYTYETALTVTNKVLMKQKMLDNGIPTARYYQVRAVKDLESHDLSFPVIVKPADSNSSKGVRLALDSNELSEFLGYALEISRIHEAIVEEYKEGLEIGVDCLVRNGEVTIVTTKERRKIRDGEGRAQQIYGCVWPADISAKNYHDLEMLARSIVVGFGLDNTPLMFQAIINGNDINVIEFAPRIGGGESFRIIQLSTGFDIVHAGIDSFLGVSITLDYTPPDVYYADNFIYARPGLFGEISGFERLVENRTLAYLDAYKTKGMEIGADLSSNNRVGVFTVTAEHREALFDKIRTALEALEVYDIEGKPIMRKDIYPDSFEG